jgi:hypothetical protein
MNLEHQRLQHPNVHQAFSPWSEEQILHVAVMYSNPLRWETRRKLLNDFRKRTEASPNVRLYIGEVAFGDRPFEVTSRENPLDFQFRTSDELWHKENVLNLIVQRMPPEARYIAYMDGDVHMSREDWALEAIHQLQHYQAVQLFHQFTDVDRAHRPIAITNGFAYSYTKSIIPEIYQGPMATAQLKPRPAREAVAKCYQRALLAHTDPVAIKAKVWWGATGLGWAFRRSAWDLMGGLLDICILGSADWHMAYGMAGLSSGSHHDFRSADGYTCAILAWQQKAQALTANIGYIDNHITHYWHGPKANRFYRDRSQILVDHQFDPDRDLKRDWQGLWQLAGNKPRLRDDLRAYFRARFEDDPGVGQQPLVA